MDFIRNRMQFVKANEMFDFLPETSLFACLNKAGHNGGGISAKL